MKEHPARENLLSHAKAIRKIKDEGWSLEILAKIVLGDGIADTRDADEKAQIEKLYREVLAGDLVK